MIFLLKTILSNLYAYQIIFTVDDLIMAYFKILILVGTFFCIVEFFEANGS